MYKTAAETELTVSKHMQGFDHVISIRRNICVVACGTKRRNCSWDGLPEDPKNQESTYIVGSLRSWLYLHYRH